MAFIESTAPDDTRGVARAMLERQQESWGFVPNYAKLFSDRYAADNVRMNNVLPGFIDSRPEKDAFRSRIPMERYGRVEEVAATISFLASEGGGYVTGQNIRVDGGITRSV